MAFNSYIEWKQAVDKIGFADIILGVKDTIEPNTVYIQVSGSKVVGSDNFKFVIGYSYSVVASVPEVDSHLVKELSELLDSGLEMVNFSETSHLYNFSGTIYLPVGSKGDAFE